jgi:hypothetical protein
MSELFNVNHPLLVTWGGKTFTQITSLIKQNAKVDPTRNISLRNIILPNPLKLYRREIANHFDMSSCFPRTSFQIAEIERPGGTIVYGAPTTYPLNGLATTIDSNLTTNTYERPGSCSSCTVGKNAFSESGNALRRVRSSGMIKKQFDLTTNAPNYYTNTAQYLKARNINFEQNQYNFVRMGDTSVKPGSSLAIGNLYVANGITNCPKYKLNADTNFKYIWIDSNTYTVTIPVGAYDVNDLNSILKQTMLNNKHYFVGIRNTVLYFLLNITFNNYLDKIDLQVLPASTTLYSVEEYYIPDHAAWSNPSNKTTPQFILPANIFAQMIGFQSGTYPANITGEIQTISSSLTPSKGVGIRYQPLYYKPNNSRFAQQGAVSASSLITRIKYDTITTNASLYANPLGAAVANALAYSSNTTTYTLKDKLGYPMIKTPIINKYTGELKRCNTKKNI